MNRLIIKLISEPLTFKYPERDDVLLEFEDIMRMATKVMNGGYCEYLAIIIDDTEKDYIFKGKNEYGYYEWVDKEDNLVYSQKGRKK